MQIQFNPPQVPTKKNGFMNESSTLSAKANTKCKTKFYLQNYKIVKSTYTQARNDICVLHLRDHTLHTCKIPQKRKHMSTIYYLFGGRRLLRYYDDGIDLNAFFRLEGRRNDSGTAGGDGGDVTLHEEVVGS